MLIPFFSLLLKKKKKSTISKIISHFRGFDSWFLLFPFLTLFFLLMLPETSAVVYLALNIC